MGNGAAALSAARAIRRVRPDDEVTIVSQEPLPAYSPVLLPHLLEGRVSQRDVFLCERIAYREWGVRALLGRRAVALDPAARRVVLEDGSVLSYDRLLIATGSQVVRPPVPGAAQEGVHALRTLQDARALALGLQGAARVALVGGGLVSVCLAAALRRIGKQVAMVVRSRLLRGVVDEGAGAILEGRLRAMGVELRPGRRLVAISREGRRLVLELEGEALAADLVVLATGVRPNADLARGGGLCVRQGIVVDARARADREDVYAAGDVAESPDALGEGHLVNATWSNAVQQGWAAGMNMAGLPVEHRSLRANVSQALGLPFASAGALSGPEERVSRGEGWYRKLVWREGRLVGAVLVGGVEDFGALCALMRRGGRAELDGRRAALCPLTRSGPGVSPRPEG